LHKSRKAPCELKEREVRDRMIDDGGKKKERRVIENESMARRHRSWSRQAVIFIIKLLGFIET